MTSHQRLYKWISTPQPCNHASNMLRQLIKTIWWEEGNIPTDWKDGLIAVIPKKGNLRDCNSY